MSEDAINWTPSGNRRRPSYKALLDIVAAGLTAISKPALIQGAFRACGLLADTRFSLSTRFVNFNPLLQSALHPDAANLSHEILVSMSRTVNSSEPIELSNVTQLYNNRATPTVSTQRINRRVRFRQRLLERERELLQNDQS